MRSIISILFSRRISGILVAGLMGLFSHMAYSAAYSVCAPTDYMPSLTIHQDMTVTPAGYTTGEGIVYSQPVVMSGPVTCASGVPSSVYVHSVSPTGTMPPDPNGYINLDYGFKMTLALGITPTSTATQFQGILSYSGSSIVPKNVYPGVFVYPPKKIAYTQDFDVVNKLIGYIYVSDSHDTYFSSSDTSGMTAVYFTGHIHIPPYCTYTPTESTIIMPTVFAADFAAAGPGGPVGAPHSIGGSAICAGGSSAGDGDLVHISILSYMPLADSTTMLIQDMPDVGIQVYDSQHRLLPVNDSEAGTAYTKRTTLGEEYWGAFDYPLTFQLVSVTGKAPPPAKNYSAYLSFNMSMD